MCVYVCVRKREKENDTESRTERERPGRGGHRRGTSESVARKIADAKETRGGR